jgi:TIR domain-containing protein
MKSVGIVRNYRITGFYKRDKTSNMSCDDWVFISYASEDQNIAQKLFKDLKEVGLMPWIDTEY